MKKVIAITLLIVMVFQLSSCFSGSNVEKVLSDKYGCSFNIEKVGGRINSSSTTYYLTPEFDNSFEIKAVVTSDGKVKDNVIDRVVGKKFSDIVNSTVNAKGIDIVSWVTFVCQGVDENENNINTTFDEYLEKYKPTDAIIYFVLRKGSIDYSTAEKLTSSFIELSNSYGIDICLYGVVMGTDFDNCADDMVNRAEISSTWFSNYTYENAVRYAIIDGKSNLSIEELQNIISG